jgi:hypothetical protein
MAAGAVNLETARARGQPSKWLSYAVGGVASGTHRIDATVGGKSVCFAYFTV